MHLQVAAGTIAARDNVPMAESLRTTTRSGTLPQDPLCQLPNLGPKSAAVLRRAGITDVKTLRTMGSVAAYALAKTTEPRVSLNLLWALEGALSGLPWQQVAREHRTSLLLALEDRLRR